MDGEVGVRVVANGSVKVSVADGTIAMSDGEVGVGIVADGNTRVSVADGTITLLDGEVGVRVVTNGSVKVSVVDGCRLGSREVVDGTITMSDDEVGLGSREVCDGGGGGGGNITFDDVTDAGGWDVTGGGADGATCDGEINVAVVDGRITLSDDEVGLRSREVCDGGGGGGGNITFDDVTDAGGWDVTGGGADGATCDGEINVAVVDGRITLSDDEVGLRSREVCDGGGGGGGNITFDDVTDAGGWDVTGGGADGATCDGEINVAVVDGRITLSDDEVGLRSREVCDGGGGGGGNITFDDVADAGGWDVTGGGADGATCDGEINVAVVDGTITLSDGGVGVGIVADGNTRVSVADGTITLSDDEVGLRSREVCDGGGGGGGNITLDDVTGAGGWDVTGGGADGATCDSEINVAVVDGLSSKLSPAGVGVAKAEVCDVTGGLIIMDDAMNAGDVANRTFEVVGASSDDDISSKLNDKFVVHSIFHY